MEKASYDTLLALSSLGGAAGKRDDAAHDLKRALGLIEQLSAGNPQNTNDTLELANVDSRMGQMLLDGRDAAGAIPEFTRASGLLLQLLQPDPRNATFRRGRSAVEAQWAAALRGAGHPAEGLAHNQEALKLAQALTQDSPKSAQYHMDVGVSERKSSDGLLAAGDPAAALQLAGQATEILCKDQPGVANPNTLANCGRAQLAGGNADLALHNPQGAEAAFRAARAIASAQANRIHSARCFARTWRVRSRRWHLHWLRLETVRPPSPCTRKRCKAGGRSGKPGPSRPRTATAPT